jgi:hypothetical protein
MLMESQMTRLFSVFIGRIPAREPDQFRRRTMLLKQLSEICVFADDNSIIFPGSEEYFGIGGIPQS